MATNKVILVGKVKDVLAELHQWQESDQYGFGYEGITGSSSMLSVIADLQDGMREYFQDICPASNDIRPATGFPKVCV